MEIQHFLHAHPLKLQEIIAIQGLVCTGCGGLLSGQNYVCRDCDSFSLHRSCSNLPRVIQHHLHPCLLNLALEDEFRCVACQQFCKGFAYRCEKCDFLIDPDCSQLPSTERPANGVKENSIQHFGHEHCLTLFRDVENDHKLTCKVCGRNFCSCCDIYGCCDCQLFLHKSCLTILPRKVHPFSHRCPLTLCTTSGNSCNGCGENSLSLIFRCSKCGFYLCVPCWLEPAMKPQYGDEVLTQHPLFLQCQSTLSCGKLLHQFNHFSHPSYPVSLMPVRQLGRPSMRCDLCRSYCGDDAFLCFKSECRLCLHVKCAFLTPTVIYEEHDHPLTVVDNICDDKLICQSCHVACINSPAFCCQQPNCNYGLHILCCPLPRITKHQCHVHPLLLEDYYLDEDGDDANNFCCHFCEERWDPVLCVYRCVEGCAMVCEVKCVISEVMASLRGERGNVELRTVGNAHNTGTLTDIHRIKAGHVAWEIGPRIDECLSLREMFESLSQNEVKEVTHISFCSERESDNHTGPFESTSKAPSFVYSKEGLAEFMGKLRAFDIGYGKIPDFLSKHDKFISLGDVLIPRTLVHTFQDLLNTYGDISAKSEYSNRVKSMGFWFLCGVIHSMQATKVANLTGQQLAEWWDTLKWVKQAGFEIQFILDHMTRVARAHFHLRALRFLEEQERDAERIAKEIEELKVKLKETKKRREDHRRFLRDASTSMKECLEDARALQWKPAAEGIIFPRKASY